MLRKIPDTDEELDVIWREVFGQPLPLLGAPKIAGAILAKHLAERAGKTSKD